MLATVAAALIQSRAGVIREFDRGCVECPVA